MLYFSLSKALSLSIYLSNAPCLSPLKQGALDFIVKAGAVAEEEGHHPDLHLEEYRNVRVQVPPPTQNGFIHCYERVIEGYLNHKKQPTPRNLQ